MLGEVATLPTIRLGLKFILLSMVRKSELQDATWDEVDFANAVWSIPKARMKRSRPHNVYLSTQMLDILIDVTRSTPEARALLERHGVVGPPTMIFLSPSATEAPGSRLIGEMSAQDVASALQSAGAAA